MPGGGGGGGWALVYLLDWDKSVSCLTERASFGSSTTKAVWTKVFFKVQVLQTVSFVTSSASKLVFHFDVAICAGHLNFPACVLTGAPPKDAHWLSYCELWSEVWGWCTAAVKGKQKGMPCWKLYRGHVCISDWELSQTDATESYQDICNFCKKEEAVK